jgi:osmoprotectant transport system ATP-binding protein
MAEIAFRHVTKQYPNASEPAVNDVTFDVGEGETCMLLGTSGSGKTTLLRMVNRLIEPTSGEILMGGKDILKENPIELRRQMGYVIQQVGLFPHMTIAENIRVPEEISGGWSKQRMRERVDELLKLVGLDPVEYRSRYPRQLSGGQQQRVGLARALATDPAILLMDEPFGALDAITRERMQQELLNIQHGVRKTILFVTHDVEEAFRLGDKIAILSEGRLMQFGSPIELLAHPANPFVARLVGADNILRQLEYLPVTTAMVQELNPEAAPPGGEPPRCPSNATLLRAMFMLIEKNVTALSIYDEQSGKVIGYVTLSSINREITRSGGRVKTETAVQ